MASSTGAGSLVALEGGGVDARNSLRLSIAPGMVAASRQVMFTCKAAVTISMACAMAMNHMPG